MTNQEIIRAKIHSTDTLQKEIYRWRMFDKKIVFTNGCFDILHYGHIDYLSKAADLGDKLIVALNSDDSVKRLGKGDSRPLQPQTTREMVIASLHFVDAVILFNEDTPYELIKLFEPDVLVKGGDWNVKDIIGYDIVTKKGGKVTTIPYVEGFSTTNIEQKIKNAR